MGGGGGGGAKNMLIVFFFFGGGGGGRHAIGVRARGYAFREYFELLYPLKSLFLQYEQQFTQLKNIML